MEDIMLLPQQEQTTQEFRPGYRSFDVDISPPAQNELFQFMPFQSGTPTENLHEALEIKQNSNSTHEKSFLHPLGSRTSSEFLTLPGIPASRCSFDPRLRAFVFLICCVGLGAGGAKLVQIGNDENIEWKFWLGIALVAAAGMGGIGSLCYIRSNYDMNRGWTGQPFES